MTTATVATTATESASISCEGLSYRYGGAERDAVSNVSFTVEPGQVAALVGPSGCGKSTLLRTVAGLLTPTTGSLLIDGADTVRVPADKRMVGWVPQSYALFGHLTVEDNIAFGLKARRVPTARRRAAVQEALELCRITEHAQRHPDDLSGGQRQRVAIARALATNPRVLLLDEPLSALDPQLRKQLRVDLLALLQRSGVTTLMVTHDQVEALSMADKVAVMRDGCLEQYSAPQEIWSRPANGFVAQFVSEAHLVAPQRRADGTWQLADGLPLDAASAGTLAAVRPTDLVPDPDGAPLQVTSVLYTGTSWTVTGTLVGSPDDGPDSGPSVTLFMDRMVEVGDTVRVSLRPETTIAMVQK